MAAGGVESNDLRSFSHTLRVVNICIQSESDGAARLSARGKNIKESKRLQCPNTRESYGAPRPQLEASILLYSIKAGIWLHLDINYRPENQRLSLSVMSRVNERVGILEHFIKQLARSIYLQVLLYLSESLVHTCVL